MKRNLCLSVVFLFFSLFLTAQSLPKAEEAYAQGNFRQALVQYEEILKTATGEVRLQAQLRKAACEYNLGEYMTAAKTMLAYELPEEDIWKARFLLYRVQMSEQVASLYPVLMNESEIVSEGVSAEEWTQEQWNTQIDKDYQTLWALRAMLINAPVEKESLILNTKDTDKRRIPTLFDVVIQSWVSRLQSTRKPVPLVREAEYTFLDGTAQPVFSQKETAEQLAYLLETAYLLDGKNRQDAKTFWRTDYILLPFDNPALFTLDPKEKAFTKAIEQLQLISGYTPQKMGFWSKLKKYVSPNGTEYGRSYAAYRAAQLLHVNDDPETALKICQYAMQSLEGSYYVSLCEQLSRQITEKELFFTRLPEAFSPRPTLSFSVRNAPRFYVRIYKTSAEELQALYREAYLSDTVNSWNFLSQISSKNIPVFLDRTPFKTVTTTVSYEKPYRSKEVSIQLPELEKGFYVSLSSWDESFDSTKSPVLATVLNITDLALFITAAIEDDPDKYTATLGAQSKTYRPDLFRFYTVNLKTGDPAGNADLDIITAWNGTRKRGFTTEDGTSTLAGEITVSPNDSKRSSHFVNVLAQKEGSSAYTANAVYFHFYNKDLIRLYTQTDRPIYRPGQNVKLAVNAFEVLPRGLKVFPNRPVEIEITNASGEKVFSAAPFLNEMGTAQSAFNIPENVMLGTFQIRASVTVNGRAFRTYETFRVEDFKRPDYELTLLEPEKTLEYGKAASITGHAQYYFGTPLQNATVKYTVLRQDYVPPFYWWRVYALRPESTSIAQGETSTDEKGDFKISFTPSLSQKNEQFAKYVVKAEVYDESGRPVTASNTYTVSAQPKLFKVEFSQGFYNAQEATPSFAQIDLTDANGQSISGKITLQAHRLENKLPVLKDPEFYPARNPSLEQWYENAKAEETAFTKTLNFKNPGSQTIDLPALAEGVYRLTLKAEKADAQQLIFIVANEESNLALPDVTLAQHAAYYPGETARILLGAGDLKGSKRVEVYYGDTFLKRKEMLAGGVSVYSFPVEQEERGGLAVAWFGASDYKFHQGSANIEVPFDNKELGVTFQVPSSVRPGETATWKLTAKDITGNPVQGQASVTVYDKSLDYYAKKENPFTLSSLFSQTAHTADHADSALNGISSIYYQQAMQPFLAPPLLPLLNLKMQRYLYRNTVQGALSSPKMMMKSAFSNQTAEAEETLSVLDTAASAPAAGAFEFAEAEDAREETGETAAAVRTDFSETAYFNAALPLINGQASVRFTLPQSLTAWNILGFVLTKNADFGAFTAQTVTRKDFMVRLQMPRFYREGDKGVLQAAITNLTSKKLSADIEIIINKDNANSNALFNLSKSKKTVSVGANATEFVTWDMTAPFEPALYNITVTARSGKNSDAEQKILPVYPGEERLMATANLALKNGMNELSLSELKGVAAEKLQTASLTLHPSLVLSILNSMPAVLSQSYNDLVSALNRYIPLAVINKFYTQYPQLQQAVAKLPKRTGTNASWNESDPLRLTLLEQTPWLLQSLGKQTHTADIIDLFNPQIVSSVKTKEMAKILKFQNKNGSFSWFPGGQEDEYLTLYTLNAFAQALAYGADIPQKSAQQAFSYIVPRIEKRLQEDKTGSESTVAYALYAAYTLSGFPPNWAQTSEAKPYIKRWADYADQQSRFMTALGQIYAAAVYHRLGDDIKANRYLDLVLSRMKQNDLTGAYFAPEAESWVWYRDTLSTQTVTLRTLLELRPQSDKIDPMTQWLLFNRQTNSWSDPKAAAQAVFTLLDVMKYKGALSLPAEYQVDWAGEKKTFSFEPFDWTGDLQWVLQEQQITSSALQAKIEKKGVLTDFASLSVLYKSAEAKESPKGVINVTREYFTRFTQDGIQKIRPVKDLGEIQVGEEVEVHLKITSDSAFEYVLLSDPKPAGFESEELTSGWTSDPIWLYRENRDAATRFFINQLPAGTVTLRYVLRPTLEGSFHALPAQIQSMYAPEFGAHTAAEILSVNK